LAIAYTETKYGAITAPAGEADARGALIPPGIRVTIHTEALAAGGVTPTLLGFPSGRAVALGDWINGEAAAGTTDHAMGFTQFTPAAWVGYAPQGTAVLGHVPDPYSPEDAMTMTGLKVAHDVSAEGGDLLKGLSHYNNLAEAQEIVRIASLTAFTAGNPLACTNPALTQGYGAVSATFEIRNFRGSAYYHSGADLACPLEGTPVLSLTDGVVHLHPMESDGYGNVVSIETGRFFVRYCHLDSFAVKDGQVIHAGEVVGAMGNTGASHGAHLHFEVDDGGDSYTRSINPFFLLDRTKISVGAVDGQTW
jgi:hypothetical protein